MPGHPVKLIEALRVVNAPIPDDGQRFGVALACGFTPLHLKTYLAAQLRLAFPAGRLEVSTGLFDDLIGNLERAQEQDLDVIAALIEWADIDPRLGVRRVGGWHVDGLGDIDAAVEISLARLARTLAEAAQASPVVVSLPTLPLPPLFPQRPGESGEQELRLRSRLAALAVELAANERIRVCSAQHLDALSPAQARRDLTAELSTGFPYSLEHASALAATLSALIRAPTPKKGLITDLDGTLWSGLVGEVGANHVSWGLDDGAHRHALYQQMLASLASTGVLLGIASKNDRAPVSEALRRPDLLLSQESLFPIEVHWGPKSESVRRTIAAWNLSPDAVVMVDDSPLELAEVQAAFPGLTTLQFPTSGDGQVWEFLSHLRGLFGKRNSTAEDRLRVSSLRAGMAFRASGGETSGDEFLASINGSLEVTVGEADKARALELFNKTNQFNLNGLRLTEAGLDRALAEDGASLITVSYEDKYGPLGTIAALLASHDGSTLAIGSWVMSCRAFSRRIEHHCLQYLFERFGVDEISAAYRPTERNGPLREFLTSLLGASLLDCATLTRDTFEERAPLLVHRVVDSNLQVAGRD
jgi:FkbH-like protein